MKRQWAFRMAAKHLGGDEIGHLARVEVAEGIIVQDRITAVVHGDAIPSSYFENSSAEFAAIPERRIGVVLIEFEWISPRYDIATRRGGRGFLVAGDTVVRFA